MLSYTASGCLSFYLPGAPETPPAVAYLRSHPSAGAASDEAMSMQRQLLAEMTSENKVAVVAEFIEVEDDSDEWPAYRAAYHEAKSRDCALFVVGYGAIGTGRWFTPPDLSGVGGVEVMEITVSYVRFADLIPVPNGTPAKVTLWADYRPSQGVTAIYLCNAGSDAMEAIELTSILHDLGMSYGIDGRSSILEPIQPGMARLVTTLFHENWTYYSRYYLSYALVGLPQPPLKATDHSLNGMGFAEDTSKVWAAFRPAAPDEAAAAAAALAARLDAIEREQSP